MTSEMYIFFFQFFFQSLSLVFWFPVVKIVIIYILVFLNGHYKSFLHKNGLLLNFILWWIKSVLSRVAVVYSCHLFLAFHGFAYWLFLCFNVMSPTLLIRQVLNWLFTLGLDIGNQVIITFSESPVYVIFCFGLNYS